MRKALRSMLPGWRAMRWVTTLRIFVAASLLSGGAAHAANDGSFRIGDWSGRPHFSEQKDKKQKEKRFDRCSAQQTNADRITIIYSLDSHYLWTFELSNPSWNFPTGSKFDVSFGSREGGYFRQRVAALDPQLVRVLLPDSVSSFEAFRRLFKLDMVAGGLTTQFDLAYANQVLLALTQCVTKYGATAKSKAAVAAWLKSPIGPAAEASSDPAILKETADLTTAIVAEGEIAKAAVLKPDEVPDGVSGDTVWKMADNIFTLSVLPKDDVPLEIGDLNDLIVGGDAHKCRGDFFAGAMLDVVESATVARAYTACRTQQAATSTYYFVMPRTQGGLYFTKVIATGIEVPPTIERAIKELDAKVRGVINAALARL
jgi:hypothetical protein